MLINQTCVLSCRGMCSTFTPGDDRWGGGGWWLIGKNVLNVCVIRDLSFPSSQKLPFCIIYTFVSDWKYTRAENHSRLKQNRSSFVGYLNKCLLVHQCCQSAEKPPNMQSKSEWDYKMWSYNSALSTIRNAMQILWKWKFYSKMN